MKAVILAAGRGSRLKRHTENSPKCLVTLAGQPLLFWQLGALADAGIKDIAVVCGYQSNKIKALAETGPISFTPIENTRWAETNMLSSLLCVAEWADGDDTVISYSDIVYPTLHVKDLMKNDKSIALTYDLFWDQLWNLRYNGNILNDAETFSAKDGVLKEIGNKPDNLEQVQGQYMGLLKLAKEGWQIWLEQCNLLGNVVDRTDMTGFIRLLLSKGLIIGTTQVKGKWCEVDSDNDLDLYEKALASGNFSHDWRK